MSRNPKDQTRKDKLKKKYFYDNAIGFYWVWVDIYCQFNGTLGHLLRMDKQ